MATSPFLTMTDITMQFPGTLALDGVDLDVRRGEVVAVVGENGAGKSTMMKILSGTYPTGSYKGEITIDGETQRFNSTRDAERSGVAMIYQEITVAQDLSVAENIMMGCLPTRGPFIDTRGLRKQVVELLKALNIEIDVDQSVRSLSASYKQVVCIARALVRKPTILVLDEPTSPLTESETEDLLRLVGKLRDSGIACVYISHKLEEVFRIADRIVVLRDGKRISEYERGQFESQRIVEDIIGRKLDVMFPNKTNTVGEEVFAVSDLRVNDPSAPTKRLVDGISFSVKKGEVLGLAGLVGSGRSETLKSIFAAIPKVSGTVTLKGARRSFSSPRSAIAQGIALLTEDRKHDGYMPNFSVLHNMTATILRKVSWKSFISVRREKEQGVPYFDRLRVKAPSYRTNINQLSGGNQQKVLFAKWLVTDPKVLLLDEPTRGVDVGTKAQIYEIINDLSSRGVAIIMVSSEVQELIAMCDRILVLNGGKIAREYSHGQAGEGEILHAAAFSR